MDTRAILIAWIFLFSADYEVTNAADTLYERDGSIVQLDVHNFDDTLSRAPHGWVVEYYATWCGHCQRFAPIYKQYADDIAGWSGVIRVAALACSVPENMPLCRSQHVRGFPTVKFYPANMARVARGLKLNGLRFDPDHVRGATLRFVEGYIAQSPEPFPKLERYGSMQELVEDAKTSDTSYLYALVEEDHLINNELAKMIILDMSSEYPRVLVGRLSKSAILNQELLWQPLPSVVSVSLQHEDEGRVRFVTQLNTRRDVQRVIKTLSSGRWRPHTGPDQNTTPAIVTNVITDWVRPTGKDIPLAIPLVTTTMASTPIRSDGDGSIAYSAARPLTLSDMDSNVYYMLWNEVASRHRIRGDALPAFKQYLNILNKYHPSDGRLRSFLETVSSWIQRIEGSLDGALYINTVEGLQSNESYVVQELSWDACSGSEGRYRGYPCSLWMTFHALTVSAYETYLDEPQAPFDPMEVLSAIRNYVRHFLGCRDCANHFQRMARRMERDVTAPEDVILWLWRGHNRVNNRLAGDETEDPRHPKIQFPTPEACPKCRNGNGPFDPLDKETAWNTVEVLAYLREFYSKENILGHMEQTTALASIFPTPGARQNLAGTIVKINSPTNDGGATRMRPVSDERDAQNAPGHGGAVQAGLGHDSGADRITGTGSDYGTGSSRGSGSGRGTQAGSERGTQLEMSQRPSAVPSGVNRETKHHGHIEQTQLHTRHTHTTSANRETAGRGRSGDRGSASDHLEPSYIPRDRHNHHRHSHNSDQPTNSRQAQHSAFPDNRPKSDPDDAWSRDQERHPTRTVPPSRSTVAPPQRNSSCVSTPTPWSPCSVTCGTGMSTRLSNLNSECEMRMEMRVCQIRPCSFNIANYEVQSRTGQCTANMRSESHLNITFNGCTTIQGYRWRFCNRCHGYCCEPANDGTFWADVRCQNGNDWQMGVMQIAWIISCSCRRGSC